VEEFKSQRVKESKSQRVKEGEKITHPSRLRVKRGRVCRGSQRKANAQEKDLTQRTLRLQHGEHREDRNTSRGEALRI
jgi:hypothetical protein